MESVNRWIEQSRNVGLVYLLLSILLTYPVILHPLTPLLVTSRHLWPVTYGLFGGLNNPFSSIRHSYFSLTAQMLYSCMVRTY